MKRKTGFLIILCLLGISLGCNLPANAFFNQNKKGMDEMVRLERADIELGNLYEFDVNQDGTPDQINYTLPVYEVQPGVFFTKSHIAWWDSSGIGEKVIQLSFDNKSPDQKNFDFKLDVPKEIAENIDQIAFSTPPKEILNPDPSMVFGVIQNPEEVVNVILTIGDVTGLPVPYYMNSKKDLMRMAAEEALYYCENTMFPTLYDKTDCLLNFVEDFKDYVDASLTFSICNNMVDKLHQALCDSAMARNPDDKACLDLEDPGEEQLCTAYVITRRCSAYTDPVEIEMCKEENAISLSNDLTCLLINDPDLQNSCLAQVRADLKYCEDINDESYRESCLELLGADSRTKNERDLSKQMERVKEHYRNYDNWFPDTTADQLCARFVPAVGIPLVSGEGWRSHLECEYASNPDNHFPPISVWIYAFESDIDAGAAFIERKEGFNILSTTTNIVQTEATTNKYMNVWYSEVVNEHVWYYRMDIEYLYGNSIIQYQNDRLLTNDQSIWDNVLDIAVELIEEKRTKR